MSILKGNFRALLLALGFTLTDPLTSRYRKQYPAVGAELLADFDTEKLIFPAGLTITGATTTKDNG